jgi:hypothetical protein
VDGHSGAIENEDGGGNMELVDRHHASAALRTVNKNRARA